MIKCIQEFIYRFIGINKSILNFNKKTYGEECPICLEIFGELDEDGFAEGCPGQDCPIICPFCRTKDYKIFYGNQIPYELLNEIKNSRFIND